MPIRHLPLLLVLSGWSLAQEGHSSELEGSMARPSEQQVVKSMPEVGLPENLVQPLFDEPRSNEIWVMGSNYKASFDGSGFAFVPFLGSDAPQNYPVHLDFCGVRVAGQPMDLGPRASVRALEDRVEISRGTVTEVYHVGLDSVEQTFVFQDLPASGELVLELGVTTDLAMRASGPGWVFENERGAVRYGAAKAIDGAGRECALEQRQSACGIEIIVPTEFLAAAQMPLTVDPVISTFAVTDNPSNQVSVDAAYDPNFGTYLLVYETAFSIADHDVLSIVYDEDTGQISGLAGIDITSDCWSCPQVANNFRENAFLCVAMEGAVIGTRNVLGRVRYGGSSTVDPVIAISSFYTDDSHPDVGGFGNDSNTDFDFVVVFERMNFSLTDSRIQSQAISVDGSLAGPLVNIANVPGEQDVRPTISQSSGIVDQGNADHFYMVVWEREESPTNRDIWARVLDHDNDTTGHPAFRAYSFSDATNPVVSMTRFDSNVSSEPYWVILYEVLLGSDTDIFAVVAQDGFAYTSRNVTLMQDVDRHLEQAHPQVTLEHGDYLVAYLSENPAGGFDPYFTSLNVVSDTTGLRTGVSVRRDSLGLGGADGTATDIALTTNFYDALKVGPSVGFASWVSHGSSGSDGDISGAIVVDALIDTTGSQYCEANVNSTGQSAWIRSMGTLTSPFFPFFLACIDLPPNQFGMFLTAMGNTVTSNPGGSAGNLCLSGAIGRYAAQVASTGSAGALEIVVDPTDLPQPTGTVSAIAGQTWYFQCWSRDFQAGAPTSNFSNGIGVTFL